METSAFFCIMVTTAGVMINIPKSTSKETAMLLYVDFPIINGYFFNLIAAKITGFFECSVKEYLKH